MSYHLEEIEKGVYGQFSKIKEEFLEAEDSLKQNNKIMLLQELSDLYGAIEGYLEEEYKGTITMEDIKVMSKVTNKVFQTGYRKAR